MTDAQADAIIDSGYWPLLLYGSDDARRRTLRLLVSHVDREGFERGQIAGVKLATETIRENSEHLPALLEAR